jgi:formylmethanofuran dehydrogenase subunit B
MKLDIDLEYVRNNGEFVIYWGSDPTESSHRHPSRFAVLPRGDKIPEGIESRTIGVVDVRETETMKMANHRIIVPPGADVDLLNALTGEVSGKLSITAPVAGVPPTELLGLVRNLKKSDCTVVFYGSGIQNSKDSQGSLTALYALVEAIRATGKEAYALPMAHDTNIMGGIKTVVDSAGSPSSIDYVSGKANASPDSMALPRLVAGEFDVALVVGSDSLAEIPGPAARALASISLVYIGSPRGLTSRNAAVSIFTGDEMIVGGGRMRRMDLAEIGMKPWGKKTKGAMTQHDALQKLHKLIRQKKG